MLKNPFGLRDGSIVTIEDISEIERGKNVVAFVQAVERLLLPEKGRNGNIILRMIPIIRVMSV